MKKYILSVDQSTSGTKAFLFNQQGVFVHAHNISHHQFVTAQGWVEHDLEEIYQNTLHAVQALIAESNVAAQDIAGIGLCNQRETIAIWDRKTGVPLYHAIVWQCNRGAELCARLEKQGCAPKIKAITGLPLSPYFSAAKIAWLLQHLSIPKHTRICIGTIDAWLIFKLTEGKSFFTDYSNASRTQLFDLHNLVWSKEICEIFGISPEVLPQVCPSDNFFGETSLGGLLPHKIPIYGVMGDSHSALFGHGCHQPGQIKATSGTGSSVMMNTGSTAVEGG